MKNEQLLDDDELKRVCAKAVATAEKDMMEIFGDRECLSEEELYIFLRDDLTYDQKVRMMKAIARTIGASGSASAFENWAASTDALHARGMGIRLA